MKQFNVNTFYQLEDPAKADSIEALMKQFVLDALAIIGNDSFSVNININRDTVEVSSD
jgi:hypothetical protein